ncbi:MAG: hypothetical protein ACRBEE_12435 [Arenicella sp.]
MNSIEINNILTQYGIVLEKADREYILGTISASDDDSDIIKKAIAIHFKSQPQQISKLSKGLSINEFKEEMRLVNLERDVSELKSGKMTESKVAWISISSLAVLCSIVGILILVVKKIFF